MSDEEGSSVPLDNEFRKTDSPVSSSRYSSCGESEFERYCSANSMMGTPSLCSSVGAFHECGDSDFGESTRSFGTVEGDFDLDGFSLGGRFSVEDKGRLSILLSSDLEDNLRRSSLDKVLRGAMDARVLSRVDDSVDGRKPKEDLGMLLSNVENVLRDDDLHTDDSRLMRRGNELMLHAGFGGKSFQRSMEFEDREDDGYGEQDGNSSRCDHSEGEDSMFNSGSDGENRSNVHYIRHNRHSNEAESRGGNMMLMSSSMAFGANDWDDFELERTENDSTSQMFDVQDQDKALAPIDLTTFDVQDEDEGANDVPLDNDEVHGVSKSQNSHVGNSVHPVECFESLEKGSRDAFGVDKKVNSDDESFDCLEACDVDNIFGKPPLGSVNGITENDSRFDISEQVIGQDGSQVPKPKDQECNQEQMGLPSDLMLGQASCPTNEIFEDLEPKRGLEAEPAQSSDEYKLKAVSSGPEGNMERIKNDLEQTNTKLPPSKDKSVELNAFYDEVVHDMEEILMDSLDSPITRLKQSNVMSHSYQPPPLRDRNSTASTVGAFDGNLMTFQHARIDGIEVVGARQKKGDISLSERLVGVKEHTVYVIRVYSGEDQWEVERRYRDFYTLYRRLKSLFADEGWILPSTWSAVEWESRKFYGISSPDVVLERSALVQQCLRSILEFSYPSGLPYALIWFLSPPNTLLNSPQSNHPYHHSAIGSNAENSSALGNTVSLIVDIRPHKSVKQTLEEQHYTCPGCHKHLDGGKTRFQEFVQTFGLGKPRLCEYMGQMFCSSCHTNDTAVLPARVLHYWDFTQYPVSQLAKLYLDSIIDQPMLCVTAVNPFLMSKVKVLLHVVSTRTKIRALLDYVHCPFRGSIYRGLGSRKYLVESIDFFSLRNLIDLSRGAFAVLPTNLETILKKIQEHITEQCLVCCDVGVPCGARQSCHDFSSLIFPFQDEDEIQRCHTCKLPFHKSCFAKLIECQCGARLKPDVANQSMSSLSLVPSDDNGENGALSLFRMKSDLGLRSSSELFSRLLSTEKRESAAADHHKNNNVILMGSLPGNSL
ncbi:hypothetical protein V2J09_011979 [Rumex salicifolius]